MNIEVRDKIYGDGTSNVTLVWTPPAAARRLAHYSVKIISETTSKQLLVNTATVNLEDMPYNEQITVSISAVNCFGESVKLNISFTICKEYNNLS